MPAKAASLALPLFGPHAPRACLTRSFACSRLGTTPGGSSLSLREARSGWSLHGVRALAPCVRRGAVVCAGCPVVPVNQCSRSIIRQPRPDSKPFLGLQGHGAPMFPTQNCSLYLKPVESQGHEESA